MQKNVGGYDRIARFIAGPMLIVAGGAALAGIVTLAAGTLGVVLAGVALVLGVILTVTATVQKCPINSVLGLNTYRGEATVHSSTDEAKPSVK